MDTYNIFTDGSSSIKKDNNRFGGVGVYFGENSDNNISEGHVGNNVTNQRMELLACILGIEKIIDITKNKNNYWKANIYSDSMYTINCVTKWAPNWIQLGWRRKVGNNIKDNILNLDLIKKLYMYTKMYPINYIHVRSHQKKPDEESEEYFKWYGNYQADELATGAMQKLKNK